MWGKLYRLFNKPVSQKLPTLISRIAVEKKFINFVKSYNPDFIVCREKIHKCLHKIKDHHLQSLSEILNIKLSSLKAMQWTGHRLSVRFLFKMQDVKVTEFLESLNITL